MEKPKKEERIISLNDDLYDSMFLEELEVRLETDPLLPGGLIDLIDDVMDSCECRGTYICGCNSECECDGTYICGCDARCGCNGVHWS
ncbi:MAG: hypothetical protein OSJ25_01710 [Paramuribaculum sp.]|nr:hypothetical protein [Paramuribaculum sp.]